MKASVHIDGKEIWSSNRVSQANLDKKVNELKIKHNCQKISEIIKRNFKVFTA